MTSINSIITKAALFSATFAIELATEAFISGISPIKKVACYLFPIIETFPMYNAVKRERNHDHSYMAPAKKDQLYAKIEFLKKEIFLKRSVKIYTKPYIDFSSTGGSFLSISSPIVYVPHEHFFSENSSHLLSFTEQQKDFLLGRQLLNIKKNYNLIKTIMKLAIGILFTALGLFTGFSLPICVGLVVGAILISRYINRKLEERLDTQAITLLLKMYSLPNSSFNEEEALLIAKSAFETVRALNISKRETFLGSIWYNKKGEERFSLEKPYLLSRIKKIEKRIIKTQKARMVKAGQALRMIA